MDSEMVYFHVKLLQCLQSGLSLPLNQSNKIHIFVDCLSHALVSYSHLLCGLGGLSMASVRSLDQQYPTGAQPICVRRVIFSQSVEMDVRR